MSYRLDGKDIVISGFPDGIADSPYLGIGDMRNVNINSIQGEADVNFQTVAMTLPPTVTALAFTATNAGDLFTVTSVSGWYAGMAIVLVTWSGTGPSTGVVYYVGNIVGLTFQIFASPFFALSNIFPIAVTGDGSGTLSTYTMAKPMDKCTDNGEFFNSTSFGGVPALASYVIDTRNQVWVLTPQGGVGVAWPSATAIFLGNIGSTITSSPSSICVWNGYLFLFRLGATDYWDISNQAAPLANWVYSWAGVVTSGTRSRKCLVAQDDAIYICNGDAVASLLTAPNETFDPTDSSTYTGNNTALQLPVGEVSTCLAELGTNLLVGGVKTFIYPWDRVSTSYSYPMVIPERYISMIVSAQSNAFIFAGNRGRIYIANGANVDLFKKIPDYVSGVVQPYYMTGGSGSVAATTASGSVPNGDAMYWRNQLYFSMIARSNAVDTLSTVVGVWAIDLETKALRMVNKLSYGTYAGTIPVLVPVLSTFTPGGEGIFAGWVDASGNIGIDTSTTTPYSNYETTIDCDMIPVGTFLAPLSPTQLEWKTSRPLVTGEGIKILYRKNLTDTFTLVGEFTTAGAISSVFKANFEKVQWAQIQIATKSTASSPSYVPVTEIRLRDWPN